MTDLNELFCVISQSSMSDEDKRKSTEKVLSSVNLFIDYVSHVCRMDAFIASVTDYNSMTDAKVNSMDRTRTQIHNNCIQACRDLNKLCAELKIDPVCNFPLENRYQVADFCGAVVGAIFLKDRDLGSFDEIINRFEFTNTYLRHVTEKDFNHGM